jgi:hypothetical protein
MSDLAIDDLCLIAMPCVLAIVSGGLLRLPENRQQFFRLAQ